MLVLVLPPSKSSMYISVTDATLLWFNIIFPVPGSVSLVVVPLNLYSKLTPPNPWGPTSPFVPLSPYLAKLITHVSKSDGIVPVPFWTVSWNQPELLATAVTWNIVRVVSELSFDLISSIPSTVLFESSHEDIKLDRSLLLISAKSMAIAVTDDNEVLLYLNFPMPGSVIIVAFENW